MVMDRMEEQHAKAPFPILITLLGMVMDRMEEQPKKAQSPILVTLSGIVIDWREVQPSKALSPILMTLSGIVMDWRKVQPAKAPSPINCVPFFIVYEEILLLDFFISFNPSAEYSALYLSFLAFFRSSSVIFSLRLS